MKQPIIKIAILICFLTSIIGNVYAQSISSDWTIDPSWSGLIIENNSYVLSNPSLENYILINTYNNTIFSLYTGSNASEAINFCTQQTNTYLHISPGHYTDNGEPINIIFNSGSSFYGDGASTIIAIKSVSSVLGSTGGVWGNFTMSGT